MAEIKVGDKNRSLLITPRVLDVWMKKHNLKFETIGEMDMEQQSDLIWFAFERGEKSKPEPLTKDQLENAMDTEQGFDIIRNFQKYMMEMMAKMSGVDDEKPKDQNTDPGN